MKSIFRIITLLVFLSFWASAEEITFLYMAQAGFQPQDILHQARQFESVTGHRVNILFPEYEDRHEMIQRLDQPGQTDSFDIILVDLIWVEDLLNRGILTPLNPQLEADVRRGIEPPIYQPFESRGELWAVPFNADFQLLMVNREILEAAGYSSPPRTLEEMTEMARTAKDLGLVRYPLFESWDSIEALICEYTWTLYGFGGDFLGPRGVEVNSPQGVEALTYMRSLLEEELMNPYSLQSHEGFVSDVFLAGDAMFVTNWTFIVDALNEGDHNLGDQWQPALIPVSQSITSRSPSYTICGFEGLGVPSGSRNKDIAWEFIRYLSSFEFQQQHVEFLSVWRDIWEDPITQQRDPFLELKREQVLHLAHRPYSVNYPEISQILRRYIHQALKGYVSPQDALNTAQQEIEEIQ